MKRNTCLVCGSALFPEPVLRLENLPASAQEMPGPSELDKDRGCDLELCKCSGCGLLQLNCEPVEYYRDVIRSCGFNDTVRRQRLGQYSDFISRFSLEGRKIIEVGCGRGEFLELFNNFKVEAAGLEHSAALVAEARKKGLSVYQGFAADEATIIEGAPYDAFVSFNYLEHLPDPNGHLRCIYGNLKDGGCGLISVPSLEYIAEEGRWYELVRDHLVYHTEQSLRSLLERNGFAVLECRRENEDSILATVQKRGRWDGAGLKGAFEALKTELRSFIEESTKGGGRVAVWGASHQSFTLLATTGVADKIEFIVDSAPFKQNRFSPVSHIKIVPPERLFERPVETVIIIAPAYTQEIYGIIRENLGSKVRVAAISRNEITILS